MKKKTKDMLSNNLKYIINILECLLSASVVYIVNASYKNSNAILTVIALLLTLTSFSISVLLKKHIDDNQTNYDKVRENLEQKIIALQKSLSNTEEQWKLSNHLILSSQLRSNDQNDIAIRELTFLKNFGLEDEDFTVDEKLIFYLTSFSSKYESTYKTCKDICKRMSFNLIRGDEIESTGDIFSQIIRYIVKASLIIVNIDGKNPNVFYELGIAHTLGKNIIFISQRDNEPPFDVRQYRTVFYSKDSELKETLPEAIDKLKNKKSIEDSFNFYHKTLDLNPSNEDAILELAQLCIKTKKFDEALLYCNRILEMYPNNTFALLLIGKIYSAKGDHLKASEIFNSILKKDPKIWKS